MILWWTYQQLRASNPKTRLAAIAKLVETPNADVIEPLLFALKDKEAEVRGAAALALGQVRDLRVLEPLLQQLRDPVALVRATAADALGQLKDPRAIDWLLNLLQDADAVVRTKTLASLQKLGWEPQTDAERTSQIVAKGNVRQVAELGSEGIAPLIQIMREGSPEKQLAAVRALGETGDPAIIKPLLEALRKNDSMIRVAALEILEELADAAAFEPVERLLRDKEPTVRAAAVETAVRCGGNRAVPMLLRLMKDPSWEVRQKTASALGSLKDAAAVEGLVQLLRDKDRDVRESAAGALGQIRDAKAIPSLILAMLDMETSVRKAAALALMRVNHQWFKTQMARDMIPQIKSAVTHREYWISHSAGKLLDQILAASREEAESTTMPEPAAVAASQSETPLHAAFTILADLLRDADRDLRLVATEAFGQLRERNAAALLKTASQDGDVFVRQAAERALAALN